MIIWMINFQAKTQQHTALLGACIFQGFRYVVMECPRLVGCDDVVAELSEGSRD